MDPDSFLEKVYDAGELAELDIVGVHGLNITGKPDHWWDTWTLHKCNWIQDLLPIFLPKTRIYLYKYNSNAFDGSNAFSKEISFSQRATDFLQTIHQQRLWPQALRRPILFIAHSMGGLLVKSALIIANQPGGDYRDIATSSKGLATFGTPHRGGNGAMLANTITNALNLLLETPKAQNVQVLQSGPLLDIIAELFLLNYRETILISSFYEMQDYKFPGYRVVRKESATLKNGHHERRIGVNADHSKMVKFPDENHARGRLILKEIRILAEKILQRESPGSPRSIQSNGPEGTREQHNSFNPSNKATARDEWEEGSTLSDGDVISEASEPEPNNKATARDEWEEDSALSDGDVISEASEPEPTAFSARPKPLKFISNTEPKQPVPLFWMTCQACRFQQACPEHCLGCRTVQMAAKRPSHFETPPPCSSRLLLSYEHAELCPEHQAKWKQLRGQQHPLSGFSWSANQPTTSGGYGHKYPFYSAGDGSKSRQEFDNIYEPRLNELNSHYGPPYPPPPMDLYHTQQYQIEKELAADQSGNAWPASPSLYGNPRGTHPELSRSAGVRVPAIRPNAGYASASPFIKPSPGAPDLVYGSKSPHLAYLSHEAPAISFDFQNRLRKSPLPRSRSTQPGLRRPLTIESPASTTTSITTKPIRALYSGTTKPTLRRYPLGESLASTIASTTTKPTLRRYPLGRSLASTITSTTTGSRSTLHSAHPFGFPEIGSSANSTRAARVYGNRYQRGIGRRGRG